MLKQYGQNTSPVELFVSPKGPNVLRKRKFTSTGSSFYEKKNQYSVKFCFKVSLHVMVMKMYLPNPYTNKSSEMSAVCV